jgi:hypothetical protein
MQIGSSLRRIACNQWPVWLGQVFPHYLINGTTVGGKIIGYKMCFLILTTASV